jgi:hypothetical protein
MAAPALRATNTAGESSVDNLTLTKPSGTVSGDILLIGLYVEGNPTITWPTGFSQIRMLTTAGGFNSRHFWAWKRAGGSEGSNYVVGFENFYYSAAWIAAFSGALESGTPYDDEDGTSPAGVDDQPSAPSVTTLDVDRLIVAAYTSQAGGDAIWAPGSSGMTERLDAQSHGMYTVTQAVAGASGTKTVSVSGGTNPDWATGLILALIPASGIPDPTPTVVGAGTASFTATNGATLSPGLPTGWAADDIHVLIAHRSDNTAMTSLSPNWTQLSAANNTAGQRVEVWARRAVGGDVAPTVTFGSGTVVRGARIIGVRGVDPSLSLASLQISRSDNAASATITFATLTPTPANTRLLALYAYEDDPTAASQITNWTTFTVSTSSLGTDMALGYAERSWASASTATGALTSTASGGSFANSPNVGILLALPPASGPTGTGAVSIGAPVLAGTGTFATTGTGGVSLGAPVLAGTGVAFDPEVTGTGGVSIGAPVLAGSGAFAVTGTGEVSIGPPALAGSGTFETTGSGGVSLGAPVLAGSGTFTPAEVTGTGAVAIGAPVLAGTGTFVPEEVTGTGAVSIGAPVLAGTGAFVPEEVTGAGGVSLGAPILAGTGAYTPEGITGTGAVSIEAPILAGTGTFTPEAITGTGAVSLGPPILAGTGAFTPEEITGTGAVAIGSPILAGTGAYTPEGISGTGAVAIAPPVLAGEGTYTPELITGEGAVAIGPPILAGTGAFTPEEITGTGGVSLGAPILAGSGTVAAPDEVTGTGAVAIGPPILAGTGTYTPEEVTGTGGVSLDPPILAGTGAFVPAALTGEGAVAIGPPIFAGTGDTSSPITGTGAVTIGPPILYGTTLSFALAEGTVILYLPGDGVVQAHELADGSVASYLQADASVEQD